MATSHSSTCSLPLPSACQGCKSATKPQDNHAKPVPAQEILNAVKCLPWKQLATTSAGEGVCAAPYKNAQLRAAAVLSAVGKPRAGMLRF